MKFVALVSGGKDSCFNSMECVRHGHELVCLANLYPATASAGEATSGETDSFMYQSAGHRAIEAQAECFGKPLVRRQISGKAMNQSLQYVPTEQDEVEDLFLLLKDVKKRFPGVEGVGSGAILSNYQRTRVESVCERLGLTSLAYLWRRPQSTLLNDMIGAGIDAVLVKVASFGLEPSKHLGKSLARLRPYFESLHERCGFHVCGEGGEYETLTLDCPLFVRRLVLDDTVVVMHSDDMFAPVGLLRVVECHSEPKQEEETLGEVGGATDGVGSSGAKYGILEEGRQQQDSTRRTAAGAPTSEAPDALAQMATPRTAFLPHVHEGSGGLVYLSGVRAPGLSASVPPPVSVSNGAALEASINGEKASAAHQAKRCLASARAALDAAGISMRDVCFVHLYLKDMGHFAAVNAEYCKWFEGINPPSRSCVAVPLPVGCWVELDLVAVRGSGAALLREGSACERRQVLHVRSISNWAPVCIGPYCQANALAPGNAIALIAGQIGLQPASMTLPPRPRPSLAAAAAASAAGTMGTSPPRADGEEDLGRGGSLHGEELRLCVSHASAVASAVGASLSRGCVFATLYVSEDAARAAAEATRAEAEGEPPSPGETRSGGEKPSGGNGTARAGRSCGDGGQGYGDGGKGWLRGMVEECRRLMEERFGQEEAEARAERAGTGGGGKGGGGDDDSAEEGWTSDPEELAKEAARKRVLSRRVPILPVVVSALPKNSAVELEVICMSRAALSLLPCTHYPPSTRRETLAEPKRTPFPVPEKSSAPSVRALKHGNGGEAGTLVATTTTTGSTVDRILCVVASSLSVATPAAAAASTAATDHLPGGVARETGVTVPNIVASGNSSVNRTGVTVDEHGEGTRGEAILNPIVSGLALSGARLERALAFALEGISKAVSSARLRWRHVSHLRVYYRSHRVMTSRLNSSRAAASHWSASMGKVEIGSGEALAPAASRTVKNATGGVEDDGAGYDDDGERHEELLKRAMHLALAAATPERPAMTFVPVTGLAAAEGIIVSVHATALSLDRLRTELWVRGVP